MEQAIFYVEMEMSQKIDWEYPLLKFVSLLERLAEHGKQTKAEMDKVRRR